MVSNEQYIDHYERKVIEYKKNISDMKELVEIALDEETRKQQQIMLDDQIDTLKFLEGRLKWAKETLI